MTVGLSCALALSLMAAPGAPPTVSAAVRAPAVVVVVTPFGKATATGSSRLLDAFAEALEARSDLEVRSAEQAGLSLRAFLDCPSAERLTCWARTVGAGGSEAPRHLFVLSARPVDAERDRVSATWMDLDALEGRLERHRDARPEEREDILYAASVHTPPRDVRVGALASAFAGLLQEGLQARLVSSGYARTYASLVVRADAPDAWLSVDERVLGPLPAAGAVRVEGLVAGRHRVGLVGPDRATVLGRCGRAVELGPEDPADLDLRGCQSLGAPPSPVPGQVLRWTGAATAVLGAALVGVGIQRARSGPSTICVGSARCDALGLPSLAFDPSAGPTADRDAVDPGGLGWAPLGAGLLGAGATWLTSSLLTEVEAWWWPTLAGLVVGGALFGGVALAGSGG